VESEEHQPEETPPANESTTPRRRTWTLEIAIALVVLIAVAVAIPPFSRALEGRRNFQVKANLYYIQLAVERFATDNSGTYPDYLIGGDGLRAESPVEQGSIKRSVVVPPDSRRTPSDPLLRYGYLIAYPINPFTRDTAIVHDMQVKYKDPLRNGTVEGWRFGTRFGANCDLMGNVLADFRYPEFAVTDAQGERVTYPSYADCGYPFYDLWPKGARKPRPFLPGMFFYKSGGGYDVSVIAKWQADPSRPVLSVSSEYYMLGYYGTARTRGRDLLGPEPDLVFFVPSATSKGNDKVLVPAWTRSTMIEKDDEGRFLGSPYSHGYAEESVDQFQYGNPNGIRDAIVDVLVPGEDYTLYGGESLEERASKALLPEYAK